MKRYELFEEFKSTSVYGESLGEALSHANLRRMDTVKEEKVVDGKEIGTIIVRGMEDVSDSTRGNKLFERCIVEDMRGNRFAVDGIDRGELAKEGEI